MIDYTLQQVIAAVEPVEVLNIDTLKTINGVTIDSRKVNVGRLFIPLRGERVNGHDFVVSVIGQGAIASLWQADQPHRPENVPLIIVKNTYEALLKLAKSYRQTLKATFIGVTGSSGKTTTKDLIASVASQGYPTQKTAGNQNNEIGLPLTILGLDRTTKVAVVEMGIDNFGQMDLLGQIVEPDVAIITSISESHIDNFGTLEAICQQKYQITHWLKENGLLIYNAETPLLSEYAKAHPLKQKMISYGVKKGDLRVKAYHYLESGLAFTTNMEDYEYKIPFFGEYEINNALAAIICGKALGETPAEIEKGFEQVKITGHREDLKKIGKSLIIDGTYNSNPGSLVASLAMLNNYPTKQPKIAIIGDMYGLGEKTEQLHREIGEKGEFKELEQLWTIGDKAQLVQQGALKQHPGLKIQHFNDRESLLSQLSVIIKEPRVILIKASRAVKLDEVVNSLEEKNHE